MPKLDKRVDAYIGKAADFAQPILERIRDTVHAACPDVEETMKWSVPAFMYEGSMLCSMSAHKEHCHLIFWKGDLIHDKNGEPITETTRYLKSVKDLPSKRELAGYIKQSMKLNEAGVKSMMARPKPKKDLPVPDYLMAALKKNRKALKAFEGFSPSHRREYIEWITEAKREETRQKRVATAIEWMAAGKSRNWKYM